MDAAVKLWRDHSLSIVLGLLAAVCFARAAMLEQGREFDAWLGFGHAFASLVILFAFSGFLRERNKPET
jgi:drug/metabolite transporter (DMT)-like permease